MEKVKIIAGLVGALIILVSYLLMHLFIELEILFTWKGLGVLVGFICGLLLIKVFIGRS
jgi:hypothetical protein